MSLTHAQRGVGVSKGEPYASQELNYKVDTIVKLLAVGFIVAGLAALLGGPYWYFTWRDDPHTLKELESARTNFLLGLLVMPIVGILLLALGGSLISRGEGTDRRHKFTMVKRDITKPPPVTPPSKRLVGDKRGGRGKLAAALIGMLVLGFVMGYLTAPIQTKSMTVTTEYKRMTPQGRLFKLNE